MCVAGVQSHANSLLVSKATFKLKPGRCGQNMQPYRPQSRGALRIRLQAQSHGSGQEKSETKSPQTAIISLRNDEETASWRGYQRKAFTLSTRCENRTNVIVRHSRYTTKIQTPGWSCHDCPAWPRTGGLSPCMCRQPPGDISACKHDAWGVANRNLTSK